MKCVNRKDEVVCPHCGESCEHEEIDVGVGWICGPDGCPNCGWSENPKYDSREGIVRDGDDRVFDQFGVSYHVERPDGALVLSGLNVVRRGAPARQNGGKP